MSTQLDHLRDHPVQAAIRLLAAFDDLGPAASAADIATMCQQHGFDTGELTTTEGAKLRTLAHALHGVFASSGNERLRRLDQLLTEADVRIRCAPDPDTSTALWFDARDPQRTGRWHAELAAWTALAVWQFGDRLGACRTDDCDNAFVDTTRNRSQQHCSSTCLARTHARRRRAKTSR